MKFGFIQIIFVLVKVLCVNSECSTYSGCLQQIYDGFFGSFTNMNAKEVQVGDIEVPGFKNVNIEPDNVDSIFKTVAGFLEELVGDFDLNTQFNVFHDTDNKTAIFVKTVNIADDFEDLDNVVIRIENKTDKNLDGLEKLTSIAQNTDSTTKVHVNGITPKTIVNPVLDINELSKKITENEIRDTGYNDYIDDNSTDYPIIDYIDLYKDTTNDYVEIRTTTVSTYDQISENENITTPSYTDLINITTNNRIYTKECTNSTDAADTVFPWVTTTFIKNGTTSQFDYYCDGALLSDTVIITAASCIQKRNATSEDLLVILGKRSLIVTTENEIIAKIKDIHIHDNFTSTEHNLALLVMEVPLTLNNRVEPARLSDGGDESATTGWAVSGELTLISFEAEDKHCTNELPLNTFCAVYGNDVTVCPSYGGIYVTRQSNNWFLRGIRTDEPTNNGFCVDRTAAYTDLKYYNEWINLYIKGM